MIIIWYILSYFLIFMYLLSVNYFNKEITCHKKIKRYFLTIFKNNIILTLFYIFSINKTC